MKPQRRVLCFIVPLLLWVGVGETSGQQPGTTHTRAIPLGVFDKDGKPVLGLTADQIRLRGVETDLRLTYDDSPRRIVLLLDVSKSMNEESRWKRAMELIHVLLETAPSEIQISLHAYAEHHRVIVPLTHDHEAIGDALASIPAPGSEECTAQFGEITAFSDALLGVST